MLGTQERGADGSAPPGCAFSRLLAGARAAPRGGSTLLRTDRRGGVARTGRIAAPVAVHVRTAAGRDGAGRVRSARTGPGGGDIHVIRTALFDGHADARRGILRPTDGRAAVDGDARLVD